MNAAAYNFEDQIVLISGANGNLGSAVARAYADAGASLILLGRSRERVEQALPDLQGHEGVLIAPGTDVTDPQAIDEMLQIALKHYERIDVLANTVGGYRGGSAIHETDVKGWDNMLDLNARSAFLLSRAIIPVMLEAGAGKIIHTASRAAVAGSPEAGSYAASKAALVSLTDTLALELKGSGINVNCILPGTIDTPENRQAMPKADHTRWVKPEAIARVFLFLSSADAAPLHGAHLPVYGLS
jgi:NAD(P)-dependent dehydrogenase (short-subunit alcohol dehydrogenase family)